MRDTSSFGKKMRMFMVALACAALLISLNFALPISAFEGFALFALEPFMKAGTLLSAAGASVVDAFGALKDGGGEYQSLKEENKNLQAKLSDYDVLVGQNEALRAQLGVEASRAATLKEARVIGFDPLSVARSVVVDKGSRDGVREGMPVIIAGNILLGKVSRVYDGFAHVALISEKNSKTSVLSLGAHTNGIVNGASGNTLLMDLVEKDAVLEKNDLIVTSGLDGQYPEHLIVGNVVNVSMQEGGIFKQAHIDPSYRRFFSTTVFFITNYLP